MIKFQPSAFTDQIVDGQELTKLPYPFIVAEDGTVKGAFERAGMKARVVGFQNDLSRQQIDLWWRDAVKDPQLAVGRYLVTQEGDQYMSHETAIASVEVFEV